MFGIGEFRDPTLNQNALALRWKAMPAVVRAARLPWSYGVALGNVFLDRLIYISELQQLQEAHDATD